MPVKFPLCCATAFFSSPAIKGSVFSHSLSMHSFTEQADILYCKALEVKVPNEIESFTSNFKSLLEKENLIFRAKEMESAARDIRKQFQAIADSGFPLPASSLLRKAVISVKKGKLMFSQEQLARVVTFLMENIPYILFRPTSETKEYVILIYWATSVDDTVCAIQQRAEIVRQEVAGDNFQLRFKTETIPNPRRYMMYMINNYVTLNVQSDEFCHLPAEDHKQFISFQKLLKEQNVLQKQTKKRKRLDDSPEFMDCQTSN